MSVRVNTERSVRSAFSQKSGFTTSSVRSWMPHKRKQTRKVLATAATVYDYTNMLSRDHPFLNEESHSTVPLLHRGEVVVGDLIARGSFRKTYEVKAVELNDELFGEDRADLSDSSVHLRMTNAREDLVKTLVLGTRPLVMKRLKKKLLSSQENFRAAMADLMLEAKYLARLDHPNILKIRAEALPSALWSGQHDGYFIVTDKLEETLESAVHTTWKTGQAKSLTSRVVLAFQIAQALQYVHGKRIVYRNLTPQNLGLLKTSSSSESIIQLFDFGAARELPPSTGLGGENEIYHMTQAVGSDYKYRAAEVTTTPHYNCKADVYSWAMVVYEMLSGKVPFASYSENEFIRNVLHLKERPSLLFLNSTSNLSPVLEGAWNDDPFMRPTAEQVCQSLKDIIPELKDDGSEQSSPTLHSNSSWL